MVYGGSRFGLMGKMADSLIQEGGKITGIIPKFFTGGPCVMLGWEGGQVMV